MRAIVEKQYDRARTLLRENRPILDNMARVLVERETIYTAEVDMLMQGASYTEVLAYMEKHDKGEPDDPFGMKEKKAAFETAAQDPAPADEPVREEPTGEDTNDKPDKE